MFRKFGKDQIRVYAQTKSLRKVAKTKSKNLSKYNEEKAKDITLDDLNIDVDVEMKNPVTTTADTTSDHFEIPKISKNPSDMTKLEKLDTSSIQSGNTSTFNKLDSWFIHSVRKVTQKTYEANNAPLFKLENTLEAAKINTEILASYDYDFEKAINAQHNTM